MKKITSLDELRKVSRGDNELVKEFITKFIAQLTKQISDLNEFLVTGNVTEIKSIAHKMKSSMFYFGMHRQRELAIEIEQNIQTDFTKIKPFIQELTDSCRLAIIELNEELIIINKQ